MPTQNVNLGDQHAKFVRHSVAQGRYKNVSEVVRAALRLLEHKETEDSLKLEALRKIAKQSFQEMDRGEYTTVASADLDNFLDDIAPSHKQD